MKLHFFDDNGRRSDATDIPAEVNHTVVVLQPNESVCVVIGNTVVALRNDPLAPVPCVKGHMRTGLHPSYIDAMVKGKATGIGLI